MKKIQKIKNLKVIISINYLEKSEIGRNTIKKRGRKLKKTFSILKKRRKNKTDSFLKKIKSHVFKYIWIVNEKITGKIYARLKSEMIEDVKKETNRELLKQKLIDIYQKYYQKENVLINKKLKSMKNILRQGNSLTITGKKDKMQEDTNNLGDDKTSYLNLTLADFIKKYYLFSEFFLNHLKKEKLDSNLF